MTGCTFCIKVRTVGNLSAVEGFCELYSKLRLGIPAPKGAQTHGFSKPLSSGFFFFFFCAALVHSPACLLKCPLSWEAFTGLFNYLQLAKGLCCFILSFVCWVSTIPIQKTAIRIFGHVTDFSPFFLLFIFCIFPLLSTQCPKRFSIHFFSPHLLEI